MPHTADQPHCSTCHSILVHEGAICHACAEDLHFGAPIRTAPPIAGPRVIAAAPKDLGLASRAAS